MEIGRMLVRIGIAAKLIGVSTKTLRRWDKSGQLKSTLRTCGGHRRYEATELKLQQTTPLSQPQTGEKMISLERVVGYIRVSSAKQKTDLERQREQVQTYVKGQNWQLDGIYQDIASGLNDRRSGLKRLIQICLLGHIDRVVVTYDDRLARFGTHLLEWLFQMWGVKVERIQQVNLTRGPEQQLFDDLLALMTSFTGKFHRLRRGKSKEPTPE